MPSSRAVRSQELCDSPASDGAGAVSARNCSTAATIAAASDSDAVVETSSILGRGGRRLPFVATFDRTLTSPAMSEVPVIGAEAVLAAISPEAAIERTRRAFERHAAGEWEMPSKVYLDSSPHGDFRAMPACGDGLALLKWVTSFPHNPDRDLPVVTGALLLSSAETGELLAIIECASITSLRTGAGAAVSAQVLARDGARSVGVIGCGVNGGWAARCLAAAGYGPGVCFDPRADAAETLARELGWDAGAREDAAAQDVVVTVTPGERTVIRAVDLRPGQHIAALGADAHGKAELELEALDGCRLFCDDWDQASAGGELSGAVSAGRVSAESVTPIGEVLLDRATGRTSDAEITLFDSTGLAIQDLGIAAAVFELWHRGEIEAPTVRL
jgi:alanine dehydrogenase